jgi:hypothetical protein
MSCLVASRGDCGFWGVTVCDLGINFNMDISWMSWTLDIEIVLAIMVQSDFSWTWD